MLQGDADINVCFTRTARAFSTTQWLLNGQKQQVRIKRWRRPIAQVEQAVRSKFTFHAWINFNLRDLLEEP